MTGRTHDLAAMTALGAVMAIEPARVITLATALVAVLANQIGGILPDIDQPSAPLWHNLPVGKYLGKATDKLLGGHRFISHSLLGVAIFGGLSYFLLKFLQPIMHGVNSGLVWWAFLIGLISHLVMDSFTKEGVPWLLPIPIKFGFPPIKRFRITTGKLAEKLFVFPGLLILDIWFCVAYYPAILTFIHQGII